MKLKIQRKILFHNHPIADHEYAVERAFLWQRPMSVLKTDSFGIIYGFTKIRWKKEHSSK